MCVKRKGGWREHVRKCPFPSSGRLRYGGATPCDARCVRGAQAKRAVDVRALMSRRLATAQNQIASQSGRQQTPMNKQQLSASLYHCRS